LTFVSVNDKSIHGMTTFEKKKEWYVRPLSEVLCTDADVRFLASSSELSGSELVDDPDYGFGGDIWN